MLGPILGIWGADFILMICSLDKAKRGDRRILHYIVVIVQFVSGMKIFFGGGNINMTY